MKLAVGVMGSSSVPSVEVEDRARELGIQIANRGAALITGATTGLPHAAAKGAKSAGGLVIGFSPAITLQEHIAFGLPLADHDFVFCTGLSFKGRNLINVRSGQAVIFAGGSMGALNEFTIAYDEGKIIGILQDTGGFCDHMEEWMQHLAKPQSRSVIHYSRDPKTLVNTVHEAIQKEFPQFFS